MDKLTGSSFMRNLGRAEIEVLHGHYVYIKAGEEIERPENVFDPSISIETRGRLAIPLKYVLILGVLLSAVGTIILILAPQNENLDQESI